ncbi:MAG: hypothetical protein K0R27_3572 [Xanthobacteraceae bacterium]|jgi:lipid A disaccharide synthetase|nr:hypothetical protein [Xanthobacteraceae bacterium]
MDERDFDVLMAIYRYWRIHRITTLTIGELLDSLERSLPEVNLEGVLDHLLEEELIEREATFLRLTAKGVAAVLQRLQTGGN